MAVLTICPPMPARGALVYKPQYRKQQVLPVHLPVQDEDGSFERGLSFDDYNFMSTRTHLGGLGKRQLPIPLWTQSNADVRRVLLAFLEARTFSKVHHVKAAK